MAAAKKAQFSGSARWKHNGRSRLAELLVTSGKRSGTKHSFCFEISGKLPSSNLLRKAAVRKRISALRPCLKTPFGRVLLLHLRLFVSLPPGHLCAPGSPKANLNSSQVPFVTSNGRTDIPAERRAIKQARWNVAVRVRLCFFFLFFFLLLLSVKIQGRPMKENTAAGVCTVGAKLESEPYLSPRREKSMSETALGPAGAVTRNLSLGRQPEFVLFSS